MDFVVVYIEHDNNVLGNYDWPKVDLHINWADGILKQYPDRRGIVVSHCILAKQLKDQYNIGEFDGSSMEDELPGYRIYHSLKDNPNLFLMLCGHYCPDGGTGEYRRSDTYSGNTIHTVLANYQNFKNGGDGWFRILTFKPSENKIYFYTFSNYNEPRWRTESMSQFALSFPEYLNLGTVIDVGNDEFAEHEYKIFHAGHQYEWYVEAINQTTGTKTTSDKWTFTYSTPASYTLNITALLLGLFDGATMIPDNVTIELRKNTDYDLVESKNITLNSSGEGSAVFSAVSDDTPYYIVLKHRNSIETWSKFWQSFNNGTLNYDFTDSQNKAYGRNLKMKNSKWCIYSGEISGDQFIDSDDVTAVFNAQGLSGYVIQDVTGDNFVDSDDVTLIFNNQGVGSKHP
jgi:hypothetical protein